MAGTVQLNGMKNWGTDISSAILCAKTSKKICKETSPEFGALDGYLLNIDKALCSLCLLGKVFNHLLTDVLCSLGFKLS